MFIIGHDFLLSVFFPNPHQNITLISTIHLYMHRDVRTVDRCNRSLIDLMQSYRTNDFFTSEKIVVRHFGSVLFTYF